MARLPVPGADDLIWGNLLNEFLAVEHNSDGTLKLGGTLAGKYTKPASGIPKEHLASNVQTSLEKAESAPRQLANLQDTTLSGPTAGQVLAYDDASATWVNTDLKVAQMVATNNGAGLTKADIGLGNLTNEAQLPLSGGCLSGHLALPNHSISIATPTPTHSVTLGVSSSGIAIYNTADQTNNYERGRLFWSANTVKFMVDAGGTGVVRNFRLGTTQGGTDDTYIEISAAGSPKFMFRRNSSTSLDLIGMTYTAAASAGSQKTLSLTPSINQSGTAGYAVLHINPTEQTVGSGTHLLIDAQVGGSAKFSVSATGGITLTNGAHISVGTGTGTKIGTATSQKIGFFNATPVSQQPGGALAATASYGTNEQQMINSMWSALRQLGLIS